MKSLIVCLCCLLVLAKCDIVADPQDVEVLAGGSASITLTATAPLRKEIRLDLKNKHQDIVTVRPNVIDANSSERKWTFLVTGHNLGHDVVYVDSPQEVPEFFSKAFVRVTVCKSLALSLTSVIVGWVYFVAWSVSFYPQVYENWKRKSVIGLNFDFLSLNIIGFTLYSIFNCCLYWIPSIEEEYFQRHPKGLNPVQLNDIVFSVHAVIVTLFTIFQCFIYERGGQIVSKMAKGIIGIFALVLIIYAILVFTKITHWLDFLYTCSYIKLVITIIKYIPQAVMNYRRKSTIGWSIGNVLLDFTGGILSMLQMIINADNYNDWASIFGDPTKFGLGLFSVLFDILFLIQHYILYRNYETVSLKEDSSSSSNMEVLKGDEEEGDSGIGQQMPLLLIDPTLDGGIKTIIQFPNGGGLLGNNKTSIYLGSPHSFPLLDHQNKGGKLIS